MATKITVALEDDLDGGPANETVRFGLGSAQYEIDLNKKNARAFRKKLAPFVEHARKAGPAQRRLPARTASSRQRSADVRAWAKAAGLPVSDRGRIPASVADQYEAATRRSLHTPVTACRNQSAPTALGPRPTRQRRAAGPSRLPAMAPLCLKGSFPPLKWCAGPRRCQALGRLTATAVRQGRRRGNDQGNGEG
jgi:nucleoid-associated protein Lsr2